MINKYEDFEDIESASTASLILQKIINNRDDNKFYDFIDKWAKSIDESGLDINVNHSMLLTLRTYIHKKRWNNYKKENKKYIDYIQNYGSKE